jgi:hypothetical protein
VIADRVRVRVVKKGNSTGGSIAERHLKAALASEAFLQEFRPVDEVVRVPLYLPSFELVQPGYNDGGPGQRLLYTGSHVAPKESPEAITAFLAAMSFATNADRTNAVAAALTVLLRNFWPGAKPLLAVTATKSHAGKDTILEFARGLTPKESISYDPTDWALQRTFVEVVNARRDAGLIVLENARLGRGCPHIASGFLERFITDGEPTLYSPGSGEPLKMVNRLVVGVSANFGGLSEDLLNRALPIHLSPIGNVADRRPDIGNPKLHFLPGYRVQIAAELLGMVEKWKVAGRPLDKAAQHPMSEWAGTVGGILLANGFKGFLGNYGTRRTADDPIRQGLGVLGAARPDEWLRPDDWAREAVRLGLVKTLIPTNERDSDKGRERAIGVLLSGHEQETFSVSGEDETLTLRLEKKRGRFGGGEPSTRYRFAVASRQVVPEDPPEGAA